MFPGLREALQASMQGCHGEGVKVVAPPEREISAWIGGSIRASLSTSEKTFVHKDSYDEFGPRIGHMMFTNFCPVDIVGGTTCQRGRY